jgi:hypothetical protein
MPVQAEQIVGKLLPGQVDFSTASANADPATRGWTTQQIQALLNAMDAKNSVRVATNVNVNLAAPGANIDSTAMTVGQDFLAFGQTNGAQNGIYVWNGAAVPATRRTDADGSPEVTAGMNFLVSEGTWGNRLFSLDTDDPITLDTTSLTFTSKSIFSIAVPTLLNKWMPCLNTTNDGDKVTNTVVAATPASASFVALFIEGVMEEIADGNANRTQKAAYVSGDNGVTARNWNQIQVNDTIHWNGSKAGYQLKNTWRASLLFNV